MSDTDPERGDEHEVTPLELFFDLVFVFAITQVTSSDSAPPCTTSVTHWTPFPRLRSAAEQRSICSLRSPFLRRAIETIFRRRTAGALVLIALVPVALVIPALVALAVVATVCSLVVAYEAVGRRESRARLRHPDLAA